MANDIVRKVMANIAAEHGYAQQAPAAEAKNTPLRLSEEEQALLLRAIDGEGGGKGPVTTSRHVSAATKGLAPAISLAELAAKKR